MLGAIFFGCQSDPAQREVGIASQEGYQPKYAENFWIRNSGSGKLLYLTPFQDASDTLVFGLYSKLQPKPEFPSQAVPVAVPIESVATLSATHIGMVSALGETESIVALSYPEYVYHPKVREALKKGRIENIGVEGGLNQERLLVMAPDLIMASVMSASGYSQNFGTLQGAGLVVFPNAEWTEPSVLGRAEWMVAVAALYGKQELAEKQFQQIDSAYQALAEIGRSATPKPQLIGGLPYKGTWSIAGGKSYVAKMIGDAGGDWPWANDTSAVSLQLDFESVYPIALEAPYWIRTGSAQDIATLLSVDARFKDFAAVKLGQVYDQHRRIAPNGLGNDYWESGVVEPHLLLADLLKILHPEKLPDHELVYYKKLE